MQIPSSPISHPQRGSSSTILTLKQCKVPKGGFWGSGPLGLHRCKAVYVNQDQAHYLWSVIALPQITGSAGERLWLKSYHPLPHPGATTLIWPQYGSLRGHQWKNGKIFSSLIAFFNSLTPGKWTNWFIADSGASHCITVGNHFPNIMYTDCMWHISFKI